MSSKAPVLGIDLGTTKSIACVLPAQEASHAPVVIKPHPENFQWTFDWLPSVFCLTDDGPLVGESARQMLNDDRYKEDVIRCVKRYMQFDTKLFPRAQPRFSPVEVSAFLLRHLRENAERQLGLGPGELSEAVVTVPAYFGQVERRHTRMAAARAGFDFDKVRLLDEPVAAAFGLRLHEQPGEHLALVVDLGGGTLDVTLLLVGREVNGCGFQELGRDGFGKLGGIDWDKAIAKMGVFSLPELADREPSYVEPDNIRLYDEAEKAKLDLCNQPNLERVTLTFEDSPTGRMFDAAITKRAFITETAPLAKLCGRICDRLLSEISESDLSQVRRPRNGLLRLLGRRRPRSLTWSDIDHVYMVGGGSLIHAVQEVVANRWGRPISDLTIPSRPQHQVAYGAARCAATLSHRDSLFDGAPLRSPHTVGYWYYPQGKAGQRAFQPVIQRNERILEKHDEQFRCPVSGKGRELKVELAEQRLDPWDDTFEYIELGTIHLTELPPKTASGNGSGGRRRFDSAHDDEFIYFHLQCLSERDMRITATFRNRTKMVNPNEDTSFGPA